MAYPNRGVGLFERRPPYKNDSKLRRIPGPSVRGMYITSSADKIEAEVMKEIPKIFERNLKFYQGR